MNATDVISAGGKRPSAPELQPPPGCQYIECMYDPTFIPTVWEMTRYALWLGMDVADDAVDESLAWIACQGLSALLPPEWRVLQLESSKTNGWMVAYHNLTTGELTWEHPNDEVCHLLSVVSPCVPHNSW